MLAHPGRVPVRQPRRPSGETLGDAWSAVRAGEGRRIVLIGGEAGGGKTRLAAEFARSCHDEGAAVLFGGCDAELVVPYQPWVQALDHLLRTLPPDDLDPDVATDLAVLAPLLPSLERRSRAAGTDRWSTPTASATGSSPRSTPCFAEASRRWPLVVILDDLHWGSAADLRPARPPRARQRGARACWSSAPSATPATRSPTRWPRRSPTCAGSTP